MAITTRYFSTTGAGAQDGTTWADRAPLISAGNWDTTVFTAFNFASGNSLRCFIGPGTYTFTQALASTLWTNPPTVANMLFMHGCDSSGNPLSPPDPDWMSNQPAWDASSLPVIATTTNIATSSLTNCVWRLIKFTASGRNGALVSAGFSFDWCSFTNSTSNSSAQVGAFARAYGSVLTCTGTSYDAIIAPSQELFNCRVVGNLSASSGNRRGVIGAAAIRLYRTTVMNNVGEGVISTASGTSFDVVAERCTLVANGVGFKGNATASQTVMHKVAKCQITGNTTSGIDGASNAYILMSGNRLRDNGSNIVNTLNYPTDFDNYTTDSDDATEYVDSASGDYRIKTTAATWGQDYGVGDQAVTGGSGSVFGGTVVR